MANEDKIYTLLIDIQKQLGQNTNETKSVASDLRVFIAEQKASNSKVHGLYEKAQKDMEAMGEKTRREVYGAINKLGHEVDDKLKPLQDDLAERQETKKKLRTVGSELSLA